MTFLILKGDIIHSESNAVVDDAIGAYERAGTHAHSLQLRGLEPHAKRRPVSILKHQVMRRTSSTRSPTCTSHSVAAPRNWRWLPQAASWIRVDWGVWSITPSALPDPGSPCAASRTHVLTI